MKNVLYNHGPTIAASATVNRDSVVSVTRAGCPSSNTDQENAEYKVNGNHVFGKNENLKKRIESE